VVSGVIDVSTVARVPGGTRNDVGSRHDRTGGLATAADEGPSCRDPDVSEDEASAFRFHVDVRMRDDDPVLIVGTDDNGRQVDFSPRISDDSRNLTSYFDLK